MCSCTFCLFSVHAGADGGLDFQCVFAGSDQKLTMQLKNKGKYDIGFAFVFTKASNGKSYADMFRLAPQSSGALYPGEKSMSVNVTFHSTREVTIKDESILKCEVGSYIVHHLYTCTCMYSVFHMLKSNAWHSYDV